MEDPSLSKGSAMFNLPNIPVNTAITAGVSGVLTVTAYIVKKASGDRQHLVNTHLEMKKIDAEQQANTLSVIKEMTTKTLV